MRRPLAVLFGLWAGAAPLFADSLDSLFDSVSSDTVVTPSDSAPKINALDRPVFLYFGNVETQGVGASGWESPESTLPVSSIYFFLHFQGGVDVQPIPQARLVGTFSTYLPQGISSSIIDNIRSGTTQSSTVTTTTTTANTTQTLSLDELFLDYTIYDSAFFRIGKFTQTWGYGHLFNPGNLVSDTSDAVNLKGFASEGPFSFTGLVIANPTFFDDTSNPRADEMGYAGNLGFTEGFVTSNLSAYKQRDEGTKLDAALKTSLFGFDLYSEFLGYQNHTTNLWWPGLLAGFYYQLKADWPWKFLGEYWVDGSTYGTFNRSIGLGASSDPIIKDLDLRLSAKWYHSLDDRSGQVVLGFDVTPLPKLNVALGIPWTYGPASGIYMTGNTDPEKRYLMALLTIGVKFDFEKAR
jgi:hypothetical protein